MASSSSNKGKFTILFTLYLFISVSFHFSCSVLASDSDPSSNSNSQIETETKNHDPSRENLVNDLFLKNQQLQLEKLEELVKNLTQLVSRLEKSQLPDSPVSEKLSPPVPIVEEIRPVEKIEEDEKLTSEKEFSPKEETGSGTGVVLVTKYNTFWSEKFQFISAVKLSSNPTCIDVLPYKDFEGLSKYFAVGDNNGRVYVFLRSGDVSVEFDTLDEPSPISAIVSYFSVKKNETFIVTGHENGAISTHRVWEFLNNDEWSSLRVERFAKFEMQEGGEVPVNLLEVHHVGRKKYILSSNNDGKITVFNEKGTIYGSVSPRKRPLAFLKQRLLFLTESGAGSLDIRTMKLKENDCEGLNNSIAKSYVFDATDRSKAYGVTSEGDLIQTLLLGDVMNFKCRIRSKRKIELDGPMALESIKGYLLIANNEKVYVYNVSSQHYVRSGGLRLMFSAGIDDIISSFLHQKVADMNIENKMVVPIITSDFEKLVIVSLGNGYVAMYRSKLPVFKNEFNSILWSSPVFFFILFLFGVWHFFANKKEALTSWGPDDPFSSNGAPTERSFVENSRNSEIMGLRGPSRRYGSPSRYNGGTANSVEQQPRFRATSELNFRGANVENTSGVVVPKRREGLFGNSQVVEDSN